MELNITTLDGEAKGSVAVSDDIFGLEPRHFQEKTQRLKPMPMRKHGQLGAHRRYVACDRRRLVRFCVRSVRHWFP